MRELRKQLRKNAQESLEITKPLHHEYHNTRKHCLRQRKLEDLRIMQQKEYVNNKNFCADPHKFAKRLFNPPKSGNPFSEDVGNAYFAKIYFDSNRSYSYIHDLDFPETSLP